MLAQNNQNPLAQLNDIVAPSLPSPWPLAPIYCFLLSALIICLLVSVYLFKKYKKQQIKQKMALQQLTELQQSKANFIDLNQLLKGVALLYFPRQQVASLHGEQWFDFLQSYSKTALFNGRQNFIKRLYRDNAAECSSSDFEQAREWITGLQKQIKTTTRHSQEKRNNV